MTDKRTQELASQSNMEKDPDDWVTGDEPMTGAQRSYLKTLSEEAHQPFDDKLTKAEASRRIDELQALTGRGDPQKSGGHAPQAADGGEPQHHSRTESALESLGEAISAPVLGVDEDDPTDPRVRAARDNDRTGGNAGG